MSLQLIIGFATEGTTDYRFLESIIQRTFEDVAFECVGQIEILPVKYFKKQIGDIISQNEHHARTAYELGVSILCIHKDADNDSDLDAFSFNINPSFEAIRNNPNENLCKNLVAIVPIHEIEAWMLADKELFRNEIGTKKSDNDLGINRIPESITDPKQAIIDAIRISNQDLPKKRRKDLTISELYQIIGATISTEQLGTLSSYAKFKEAVRESMRQLNYLH